MYCIVTSTTKHIKTTPTTAQEYLRNEESKKNTSQEADIFDIWVDQYPQIYEYVEPKKADTVNYDPVTSTPHTQLLPITSTSRAKIHKRSKICQIKISKSTPIHIACIDQHDKQSLKQNQAK